MTREQVRQHWTAQDSSRRATVSAFGRRAPSPGDCLRDARRVRHPGDLPEGYHTPARVRQVDGMPHELQRARSSTGPEAPEGHRPDRHPSAWSDTDQHDDQQK